MSKILRVWIYQHRRMEPKRARHGWLVEWPAPYIVIRDMDLLTVHTLFIIVMRKENGWIWWCLKNLLFLTAQVRKIGFNWFLLIRKLVRCDILQLFSRECQLISSKSKKTKKTKQNRTKPKRRRKNTNNRDGLAFCELCKWSIVQQNKNVPPIAGLHRLQAR